MKDLFKSEDFKDLIITACYQNKEEYLETMRVAAVLANQVFNKWLEKAKTVYNTDPDEGCWQEGWASTSTDGLPSAKLVCIEDNEQGPNTNLQD